MSLWIEVHCDVKSQGPKEKHGPDLLRCWCETDNGNNPSILVESDRASISKGLRILETSAKEQGWSRNKTGNWICPRCLKMITYYSKVNL